MLFCTKLTPRSSILQLREVDPNGEGLPRQRAVVSLGNANLLIGLRRIVARTMETHFYQQNSDLAKLEPPWNSEARHWIDSTCRRFMRDECL